MAMPVHPTTDRFRRTAAAALAVACFVGAAAGSPQDAHDAADAPAHVHLGEVVAGHLGMLDDALPMLEWRTPAIACDGQPPTDSLSAPASCAGHVPLLWTFDLGMTQASWLRVDFDQPLRQDEFRLLVLTPDGEELAVQSQNTYSHGIRFEFPYEGTWGVELLPLRTDGTTVRLRAALADDAVPADVATTDGHLLPNLRVTPPFEFGFAAPVNPTNSLFLASDDMNPAIEAAGTRPVSCTPDEVQEASDPTRRMPPTALVRCLRFTAGPHNAGAGHFDLRFPILDRARNDQDRLVEMTQWIHRVDGEPTQRPAGTYEFHATHGHYHYTDILFYELLRVDGPGELTAVGLGNKSGFCPADQGYAEWSTTAQAARGTLPSMQPGSCLVTGAGSGSMGLTQGWGDFYRWQRPGQYVDFSFQGDGEYVVRTTVDVHDNVLESDESDNAAYAWLRIIGDQIEILERGRGDSPWAPGKVVVTDGRNGA